MNYQNYCVDEYGNFVKPKEGSSNRAVYGLSDKLPYMHYSDSYWKEGRTIFGTKDDDLSYAYDDRLISWNYDAHKRGEQRAKNAVEVLKSINYNTPAFYQEYLRGYYENETLQLLHIVGGVNLSNGYSYMAFGWKK